MNIDEFIELLNDYESLPGTLESKSIFDVTGYPHYENVCSNILAFYLDPNNEHGLGNLLFSSLMNLADGNESQPNIIQIDRERLTNKGNRLDIVIETENQVIGIENKIFHYLNNDLPDYSDSADDWAKLNQLKSIKIILSIRNEQESSGFICVTYEQFWAKIRERLGNYISTSSQKWILYLVDFMSTIEKFNGENMELDKNDLFFIEHEERVNALLNARNKFISKLNSKVRELFELLDKTPKPVECERQWIYAKTCIVHDFILSGHSIAFDLYLLPKKWELQLFGRNVKSQAYLTELFSIQPMSNHKVNLKDSRYILQEHDLAVELEVIKTDLLKWFDLLTETENNKNTTKKENAIGTSILNAD